MSLETLRDIAIVLLAIEAFVILLFPGVIVFFVVRGLFWLHKQIRIYSPVVQYRFAEVAAISEKVSQKAVSPILAVDTFVTRVRRTAKSARSLF